MVYFYFRSQIQNLIILHVSILLWDIDSHFCTLIVMKTRRPQSPKGRDVLLNFFGYIRVTMVLSNELGMERVSERTNERSGTRE